MKTAVDRYRILPVIETGSGKNSLKLSMTLLRLHGAFMFSRFFAFRHQAINQEASRGRAVAYIEQYGFK